MALKQSDWIWHNGSWIEWQKATVHITTHALHYGSSVFEGIRCYSTKDDGPAIFRLDAHFERLERSCKIMRMGGSSLPFDGESFARICEGLVRRNRHQACYIRPIVYRAGGGLGLDPTPCAIEASVFSFEWGRYLGAAAIEEGVDAGISSWRRFSPGSMAPLGKIGGQYVANSFVSIEARQNGYTEGIMLDHNGFVSEGAGENLFAVFDNVLVTPPLAASILAGITRDTVLSLARDLGLEVRTENLTRDMLYVCDELFMTGTAAEITPVRSVDQIAIGNGTPGPVTKGLQHQFFGVVTGELEDLHGWLHRVEGAHLELAQGE